MLNQVFTEFEAYTDAHKDFDIRLTLTHPDRSTWSIRHLHVDSLHIQTGSDGCGDIAEGATRLDGWLLYFQTTGKRGLVNGELFTEDAVVIAPPGAEFCLASQDSHDWATIFFPHDSLSVPCGNQTPGSREPLQVVRPGRALVKRLQRTVTVFIDAVKSEPSVATAAPCIASVREQLCHIADQMMGSPAASNQPNGRAVDQLQLVQSAVECIEQWPHMAPPICDLARQLDVSERTLRSAFVKCVGVSPYRYVVARRMNHARYLLLKGDPQEITVREAAAKVGFWDFGRFADKHRALFGELPSETLLRKQ